MHRGIPLKVGIVDCGPGQRAQQAREELIRLGVPHVEAPDRIRGVGRATVATGVRSSVKELCGQCGNGRAAISWDGEVRMCVLSRFLSSAGNVRTTPLAEILGGAAWYALLAQVPRPIRSEDDDDEDCTPLKKCKPNLDGGDCKPAETPYEGNALIRRQVPSRLRSMGGGQ
ncbi:SPASM domain-containing protein [Spongiactinospora rosea]|uniref:SPASM domain-containing protein n=1 Tax=Spongiactinospora rosea TaxID=2248750 RepID=UPI00131443B8|nr:SPASM domain-containing protein [Spongiactinospora rosea]